MRTNFLLILIAGLALFTAACTQNRADADPSELTVLATTNIVASTVQEIAGPDIKIITLMGPGVDPHTYRPTPSDVKSIESADLVFSNGLGLEGRLERILESLAQSGKRVYALAEGINQGHLLTTAIQGQYDPHVWMDPTLWEQTIDLIVEALSESFPLKAAEFEARGEDYKETLSDLDYQVETVLRSVPASRRVLITSHDAFRYFGAKYNFEVHGIQGVSTDTEAGAADLRTLAQLIASKGIPAIFTESSVSPSTINALMRSTGNGASRVSVGGTLYSDSLGPSGSGADNYVGMILHNAMVVSNSLGS